MDWIENFLHAQCMAFVKFPLQSFAIAKPAVNATWKAASHASLHSESAANYREMPMNPEFRQSGKAFIRNAISQFPF